MPTEANRRCHDSNSRTGLSARALASRAAASAHLTVPGCAAITAAFRAASAARLSVLTSAATPMGVSLSSRRIDGRSAFVVITISSSTKLASSPSNRDMGSICVNWRTYSPGIRHIAENCQPRRGFVDPSEKGEFPRSASYPTAERVKWK